MCAGSKYSLANAVTGLRVVGALLLIIPQPLTLTFFIIYTLCGITDALDGPIARRMNTESEFGAKLDSVSDLLFYAVLVIKLIPVLWKLVPKWIWLWVAGIVLLRLICYAAAALKFHRFAAVHTLLNKATGFGVFALAYFMLTPAATVYAYVLCAVASIGSAEELVIHLVSDSYPSNCRSVLCLIGKTE